MDGKTEKNRRTEQKSGILRSIKQKTRKRKRRRRITVGILAGAILAAGIGTGVWLQLRIFQGYDIVQATETEDTDTYMFQKSGNKIVRYGIDGIELRDRKNQTLWSDHYTMENPQMISCGDAIAIYDKNGTKIVVYDTDGKAGEITASYPIVKASVAGQGVVAAILENNGESWIKYYNIDGTEIASSHPNMDSPGYPMDLSLSADGLWMAVSYAYEDGGKMKSQVAFYNFGSRGEDLVDNLASSSSYTDMLCPQIETAGTSSWVAFFDNGFRVYEGTNKPKETVSVSEDGEILSCAYADDRVVLILRGESDDHPYRMKIYNLKGKQLADENLDFYYQKPSDRRKTDSADEPAGAVCIYLKWKKEVQRRGQRNTDSRDHRHGAEPVSARGGGRRFDDPAEIGEEKHELAEIRITCGVYSFRAGWISKGAGPDSAVHGVPDSGDRTGDLDESVCDGCAE